MSNVVFPTLPGLMFPVSKTLTFSTNIKQAVSGRELRRANYTFPLVAFGLQYEFLRDTAEFPELKTLLAFFMARQGSFDSFLFRDPDDCQVVNQLIGTGDGVTRSFQLVRDIGSGPEPVANVATVLDGPLMWSSDPATIMWSADSSTAMWSPGVDYRSPDYTLSATGLLIFNVAPPAGLPIYWSGTYYYRCRFLDDAQDYSKFMAQLWEMKKVNFLGTLGVRL